MLLTRDKYLFKKFVKTTTVDALFLFVVYIYLSFQSPYLETLGWSETLKGVFFSLFSFTCIFFSPIIGTLSDKFGRFKLMVVGVFFEIIVLLIYIFTTYPLIIFLGRILAGIAHSAVVLSALARINDISTNNERTKTNGIFQSITSASVLIAPLIGGFVADHYGYKILFVVSLIVTITILIILLTFDVLFYDYKKAKHRRKGKFSFKDINPVKSITKCLKFKEMRLISFMGIISNFTLPLFVLVLPFIVIEQMGLSNSHLSICVFLIGIGRILQFYLGGISDKIGKGKAIVLGLFIFGISFIGMFFAQTFEILLILIFIKSVGTSLWNVSAWSFMSDVGIKYNIEGKVIGSYTSLARISIMISMILSGLMLNYIGSKIFLVYAFVILIPLLFTSKYFITYNHKKTS